jgi:hypothetical protein
MTRTFSSGANRNGADGKFHPYGFQHPLCDYSFSKYMDVHRHLEDGSLRDPDNWWKGWDRKISLDSMARHIEDLKCIHAGLHVYKEKIVNKGEKTHVFTIKLEEIPSWWQEVTEEDCCNAIRFNADAYKLEVLKNHDEYTGELLAWDEEDKGVFRPEIVRETKRAEEVELDVITWTKEAKKKNAQRLKDFVKMFKK